jgi:hypothetical protein
MGLPSASSENVPNNRSKRCDISASLRYTQENASCFRADSLLDSLQIR